MPCRYAAYDFSEATRCHDIVSAAAAAALIIYARAAHAMLFISAMLLSAAERDSAPATLLMRADVAAIATLRCC